MGIKPIKSFKIKERLSSLGIATTHEEREEIYRLLKARFQTENLDLVESMVKDEELKEMVEEARENVKVKVRFCPKCLDEGKKTKLSKPHLIKGGLARECPVHGYVFTKGKSQKDNFYQADDKN